MKCILKKEPEIVAFSKCKCEWVVALHPVPEASNLICLFSFSVSVQCLKTPSEAVNPQSQADMVTRVFWISVSLLESDYEHEFLMAIHLLNKVSTSLCCVAKPTLTFLRGL